MMFVSIGLSGLLSLLCWFGFYLGEPLGAGLDEVFLVGWVGHSVVAVFVDDELFGLLGFVVDGFGLG